MKKLTIDFVSDVMCPWCTLGLHALERAIVNVSDEMSVDIIFRPFELNPEAPREGLLVFENQQRKYGLTKQQVQANYAHITARGKELGFTFNMEKRTYYYNTFDAHRLLHWAAKSGKQLVLKHALISGYFTDAKDVSDHEVLTELASSVGLDTEEARAVLGSNRYAPEVLESQAKYRQLGIQSVPSMVVNGQYLVTGSQSVSGYEDILRNIAKTIH
ncbi:DsbA family oxidoreductase [Ralstonia wenshanensis]|uniref:DsbA family oxidoreductase n=1 Tax=Ralstonia wenshanensis TaxID=2842456 RepID=UPI002AAC70AD|nr:DsbA family oxidoreductase [Ralstonia wenshanensis]MDY7511224.1 DsbA family oxidoreductase [Ralstonia wenshanensis]